MALESSGPVDPADSRRPAVVQSIELFGTEREVLIVHHEQTYRLRITRTDKLILTK